MGTAIPRRFTKVVVLINQHSPKRKERKWARIQDNKMFRGVLRKVAEVQEAYQGISTVQLIEMASSPPRRPREQVILALTVLQEIQDKKISEGLVQQVDAWTILGQPNKLVINISMNKTRPKHEKERAKKRASGG